MPPWTANLALFAALRKEFGPEIHMLHDAHHRLTPIEAGRVGKDLEPFRLFWLEDPTPAELQESFRVIRRHTTTPIHGWPDGRRPETRRGLGPHGWDQSQADLESVRSSDR